MNPPDACTSIEEVRAAIDTLDREIIAALGRRFGYVKAITRFKTTAADVQAPARYQHVLATRREWAEQAGLRPDVVEQIYRELIAYFIDEEMKILHPVMGEE
jgi:isochorismate pyruvate lyase